jgi:hypothetical protein
MNEIKASLLISLVMIFLCVVLFFISGNPNLEYSIDGAEQFLKYVSFLGIGFWLNVIVINIDRLKNKEG